MCPYQRAVQRKCDSVDDGKKARGINDNSNELNAERGAMSGVHFS